MFFWNKNKQQKKYCENNTHVFDLSKTNKILTVFENGKYIDKPVSELKAICKKCNYVMNAVSEREVLKHGRINEYIHYKIIELLENNITHSFIAKLLVEELNNEFYYNNFKKNMLNYSLFDMSLNVGELSKHFFEESYDYCNNISVVDENYEYKINESNNQVVDYSENFIITSADEKDINNDKICSQLISKYPIILENYKDFINKNDQVNRYGKNIYVKVADNKYVASCFTTKNYMLNFDLIFKCFNEVFSLCKKNNLSVAIPINYVNTLDESICSEFKQMIYILGLIYDINVTLYMV